MATYSLDAEKFIAEIKRHRPLWDVNDNSRPFRNSAKEKAWASVARVFIQDFDTMTKLEQAEVHRKLYNKWRNIRDAYVRNIRSTRVNKSGGYIFMKQLSFLDSRYKPNASGARAEVSASAQSSDEHDDSSARRSDGDANNSSESDEPLLENIKRKRAADKRKKIKIDKDPEPVFVQDDNVRKKWPSIEVVDPALSGMLHYPEFENPIAMSRGSESEVAVESFDEDRSFFDSLLPAVREFDMDQKLKFRYEVLKTIKDIRSSAGPSRPQPDQGTCKPEPSSGYYLE